jgi:hypothetical protein
MKGKLKWTNHWWMPDALINLAHLAGDFVKTLQVAFLVND